MSEGGWAWASGQVPERTMLFSSFVCKNVRSGPSGLTCPLQHSRPCPNSSEIVSRETMWEQTLTEWRWTESKNQRGNKKNDLKTPKKNVWVERRDCFIKMRRQWRDCHALCILRVNGGKPVFSWGMPLLAGSERGISAVGCFEASRTFLKCLYLELWTGRRLVSSGTRAPCRTLWCSKRLLLEHEIVPNTFLLPRPCQKLTREQKRRLETLWTNYLSGAKPLLHKMRRRWRDSYPPCISRVNWGKSVFSWGMALLVCGDRNGQVVEWHEVSGSVKKAFRGRY